MNVFVGLLRAINVGGTGKLPMRELVQLCERAGFKEVQTYIQSGNVLFKTALSEARAQATLERALTTKLGKAASATLRTADELEAALARNPYRSSPPNYVYVMFMSEPFPSDALDALHAPDGETAAVHGREMFVHFPKGMGQSKLKLPFAKQATGRNLNTLTKLASMARALAS
jgi:uncharacterized protein (DUF1697 family)